MATITAAVDVKSSTLDRKDALIRGRNPGGYASNVPAGSMNRADNYYAIDIDAHDISMDIETDTGSPERRKRATMNGQTPSNGLGTIQPFTKHHGGIVQEFRNLLKEKDVQVRRILFLGVFNILCSCILLIWCQSTNSMALTAYTFLTFFDIMTLGTCIISLWVAKQRPMTVYTFGYERVEVLAVFATTMLAIFGAVFIVKECTERVFEPPEVHTGRLMLGAALGFICHIVIAFGVDNKAFTHVSGASKSSWLQEHATDISRNICAYVPGFDKLLLPRMNPFALIAFTGALALCFTDLMVDVNNYHIADTLAAVCIALMTFGTMFPMSIYSGTILLQTSPSHIIGQLDKCLREASTLDGVLEFRNEHFWTLSFGRIAGSLHVRVRRDANEQLVLAHVANKLSHLVSILTVQVIKDDWTRMAPSLSSFTSMETTKMPPPAPLSATVASSSVPKAVNSFSFTPPATPNSQKASFPKTSTRDYLNFKTPSRASSTPYGTPMKDLSFHSNLEPIAPRPQVDHFLGNGRTSQYGGSGGVPFVGTTRTDVPPPSTRFAAGVGGTMGVGAKGSGVISVNNLGTSNMYPMGRTLTNQRPSTSSIR